MKGTFFSADFVQDTTGSVRFIELNTDTVADATYISNNNIWGNLIQLISGSDLTGETINEFHVIYKPAIHSNLIQNLSQSLYESSSHITTFETHSEDIDVIYPTSIADSGSKFILRFAYDENAIVDSTYAKDSVNSFLLFKENNDVSSVVPFYYTSSFSDSEDGFNNNIEPKLNPYNIPDFAIKNRNLNESVHFVSVGQWPSGSGYSTSSEFDQQRVDAFLNQATSSYGDSVIMNYFYDNQSITENHISTLRTYHVVYGTSLDVVNLGGTRTYASFSLPSSSQVEWNTPETSSYTELDAKHYYEFSTSTVKEKNYSQQQDGLYETEIVLSSSDETVSLDYIVQNHESESIRLKTYHIEGLPDTDSDAIYLDWKLEGYAMPSGSYESSSLVEIAQSSSMNSNVLVKMKLEGNDDYNYIGSRTNILTYISSSDTTTFQPVKDISSDSVPGYFVPDINGNLKKIISNELLILNKPTGSFYQIGVEPDDLLLTNENPVFNFSLAIHNFCFAKGTEISLSNGDIKNIENIQEGDDILSYNHETNEVESSVVGSVSTHEVDKVIRLTINNEDVIITTPEHPFYIKDKGYQMAKSLEFGDEVLNSSKDFVFISTIEEIEESHTVYNLHGVNDNNNFFVNGYLVHNKPGGPI